METCQVVDSKVKTIRLERGGVRPLTAYVRRTRHGPTRQSDGYRGRHQPSRNTCPVRTRDPSATWRTVRAARLPPHEGIDFGDHDQVVVISAFDSRPLEARRCAAGRIRGGHEMIDSDALVRRGGCGRRRCLRRRAPSTGSRQSPRSGTCSRWRSERVWTSFSV